MDTSEVLVPGECALVSYVSTIDSCCYGLSFFMRRDFAKQITFISLFFASAFALKGIEYDQVPVNLIKDGGQQVQHHKIRLSLQTVEYV